MKKFWGFYKNESYSVGCNGGTVYIYDLTGKELAKFRNFPYAYTAAFKPESNMIAVKSTEGCLGFYDLDSLSLLKKITVTKMGTQNEGFGLRLMESISTISKSRLVPVRLNWVSIMQNHLKK